MSTKQKSWKPTNKWMAAQCTAMATLAVAWVNAGGWTKPLTIAPIGLVSQATAAYLVSNARPVDRRAPRRRLPRRHRRGAGRVSRSGASAQTSAA